MDDFADSSDEGEDDEEEMEWEILDLKFNKWILSEIAFQNTKPLDGNRGSWNHSQIKIMRPRCK